ncbi:MAG: hypothetical protein M5U28_52250 [Sandaracinaceae bacterium]|nr:hypothetical protein [Sandaracinaceae bacterium]
MMMIASSTMTPSERISASSDSRFSVMPSTCITRTPPARATGMPSAAISPLRNPTNAQRMASTSTSPMAAFE